MVGRQDSNEESHHYSDEDEEEEHNIYNPNVTPLSEHEEDDEPEEDSGSDKISDVDFNRVKLHTDTSRSLWEIMVQPCLRLCGRKRARREVFNDEESEDFFNQRIYHRSNSLGIHRSRLNREEQLEPSYKRHKTDYIKRPFKTTSPEKQRHNQDEVASLREKISLQQQ